MSALTVPMERRGFECLLALLVFVPFSIIITFLLFDTVFQVEYYRADLTPNDDWSKTCPILLSDCHSSITETMASSKNQAGHRHGIGHLSPTQPDVWQCTQCNHRLLSTQQRWHRYTLEVYRRSYTTCHRCFRTCFSAELPCTCTVAGATTNVFQMSIDCMMQKAENISLSDGTARVS